MAEHRVLDAKHVPPRKRATIAARAVAAAAAAAANAGAERVTFAFTGTRNSHPNNSNNTNGTSGYNNSNYSNQNGDGGRHTGGVSRQRHHVPQPQRRHTTHRRSGAPSARSKGSHCFHCGTTSTPLWRKGPSGPNTLCNACGTRWKRHGSVALRRPISTSKPEAVAASARLPSSSAAPGAVRATYVPTTVKRKKKPAVQDEDFDYYVGATTTNNTDGPAATVRSRVRERRPRCSECGTTSIPKNSDADYPRNESGEILCAGCEEDFRPNPAMSEPMSVSIPMPMPISNPSTTPISTSVPVTQTNHYSHQHQQRMPHRKQLHPLRRPEHIPDRQPTPHKKPAKIEPRPSAVPVSMTPSAPVLTYPEPPPLPRRRHIVQLPKPPASLPTPKSVSKSMSKPAPISTPMEIEAPSKPAEMEIESTEPTEVKMVTPPATTMSRPAPRHHENAKNLPSPTPAASAEPVSTDTDNAGDAAPTAQSNGTCKVQVVKDKETDESEEGEWICARDADPATHKVFKTPPRPGPWVVLDGHLQPVPPPETIQQPLPITPDASDTEKETAIPVPGSNPNPAPIPIPIANESKPIAKSKRKSTGNSNIPGMIGVNRITPCTSCGVTDTPLWRKGPAGRNTLCNACGTRWKRHGSTDLRPANASKSSSPSPTLRSMTIVAPPGQQQLNLHAPIARKRKPPMKSIVRSDPQKAHLTVVPLVRRDTIALTANASIGTGNTHVRTGNVDTENAGRDIPYLPTLLEAIPATPAGSNVTVTVAVEKVQDKDDSVTDTKKTMDIEMMIDNNNDVEKDMKVDSNNNIEDKDRKKEISIGIVNESKYQEKPKEQVAKTEVQIKAVMQVKQDSNEPKEFLPPPER